MAKNVAIDLTEGYIDFKKKDPFRFEYTKPSLDWYDIVKVEIKPDDYVFFKIELRFGNDWWLVGKNPPKSDYKPSYLWDETDLGRISEADIIRFIEWARCEYHGSRLNEICAISSSLNVVDKFAKILHKMDGERKDNA